MKPNASRETPQADDGLVAVHMPKDKAPGVRAFGALRPGQVYRVTPAEALRLVKVKGFEFATVEDRRLGAAFEAGLAPSSTPDPDAAAPAAVATAED